MNLRVTWLGHSSVVLDVDGVRLLADPLLGRHAGVLRRRGGPPDPLAWQHTDGVLLSHLHHDHAELRSLRAVGGAPVLTAAANARWLRAKGIADPVGLREAEWHPIGTDRQVWVRLTPAVHGHRPMPHRPDAATGHLVCGRSGVIWVVGDTEFFASMSDIPAMAGGQVDVAIVPVSGWGPRLSRGHLTPTSAAQACAATGARFAIPVHWGTLHAPAARNVPRGWMDRPGAAFDEQVRRHAPACEPVVLAPGESWEPP